MQLPFPYIILIKSDEELQIYNDYIYKHRKDYVRTGKSIDWIMQYKTTNINHQMLPAFLGERNKYSASHNSIINNTEFIYTKYFSNYNLIPIDLLVHPENYSEYFI